MTDSKVEPTGPSQEQMRFQDRYPGYDFDPTYYDPGEVDDDLKHLSKDDADERTGWGYLGVLCAVFVGLVGFAFGCEALENNESLPEVVSNETGASVAATPVRLNIEVEGDIVTLRGAVPDEAARGSAPGHRRVDLQFGERHRRVDGGSGNGARRRIRRHHRRG